MLKWPDKDPDEVADFQIDWTARLDGDTISSSTWVIPSGLTQNSAAFADTSTTVWLAGGTAGSTYILVNRVVTAGSRTLEEAVSLRVAATINQIVSLSQVKQALRIDHEDDDATLLLYTSAATQSVVGYLKDPSLLSVDSPPSDVDDRVTTAIIMLVSYWYDRRAGDDGAFERGYLPKPITAMLYPMRDPALA
jgi:uncharacterized phage protein (predicted DNA packaging)